jgi:MerR family transcriptional regulator, copper efflux regulator
MIASVRIGEAARETGVTIKAIRHYEAVGLLTTLEREGRYRRLSTENVDQLRLIAHCRGLGFTLREIREVLRAVAAARPACPDPVTMLAVVERRLRALDAQVSRLQLLGKRLGAARAYLRRRRRA